MGFFPFLPLWAVLLADMILKAAAGDHENQNKCMGKSTQSSGRDAATMPNSILLM